MTLSIGRIGEVAYDEAGDRTKVFLAESATTPDHLRHLLQDCVEQAEHGTRLTIRAAIGFKNFRLLSPIKLPWKKATLGLEARIPINHDKIASIVYFGANDPSRDGYGRDDSASEYVMLLNALSAPKKIRRLSDDYYVEQLSQKPSLGEVDSIVHLYSLCYTGFMEKLDHDLVQHMCETNTVIEARRRRNREIVSVAQGEMVRVPQIGLTLVERSDMATHPDVQNEGLSRACCALLFSIVQRRGVLLYSESRMFEPVLTLNGQLGMHAAGRLVLHTRIGSNFRTFPAAGLFETLVPCYALMI